MCLCPLLTRTADARLQIEGNVDIAFLNTGTRPIVVKLVGLSIGDISERKGPTRPCGFKSGFYPLDADLFVVKERS